MKELNIGGLIARVPIIQGGMAVGISRSGLASAVANAGGIIGGECFLMASRHYIADAERASRDKLLTAS
jgi:NAD(P)H-dependent flavin oxidoreductase YrpB (nitropropane dioxygenase family)